MAFRDVSGSQLKGFQESDDRIPVFPVNLFHPESRRTLRIFNLNSPDTFLGKPGNP
jgi:hypothetical protein